MNTKSPCVYTQSEGQVMVVVLSDPAHGAEARVTPKGGFNCYRFQRKVGRRMVDVLVPPASADDLARGGFSFGYPILFPFPNRVKDGRYTVRGRRYSADINLGPNHIHGLVAQTEWWRIEMGVADGNVPYVTGSIEPDDAPKIIRRQFPFPFRLTVTYSLQKGQLVIDARVRNTGKGTLPMGFGSHPYFPVPILPRGRREDCEIRVPASHFWELADLLPTGKRVPVSGRMDARSFRRLGSESYDDVFTEVIRSGGGSSCIVRDRRSGLQIRIWADRKHREWVVYAPLHRRVICFEPYTCTTNAVNLHAQGIDGGWIELPPGKSWSGLEVVSLEEA